MDTIKFEDAKDFQNLVQLRGNLTADPEVVGIGDTNIVKLRLAVNSDYKDAQGNKVEGDPVFVSVDYWGRDGADVAEFLKKGSPVALTGSLQQQRWEDKNTGAKRSKVVVEGTEIREVVFTGENAKAPSGFPATVTFDDLRKEEFHSNAVWLVGNLTRDPEIRVTPNGKGVAQFGMGVNRRIGNRDEASFFTVNAWDGKSQSAEDIGRSVVQGDQVAVRGALKYDEWEKDGQKRSKLEVTAFEVAGIEKSQRRDDAGGHSRRPMAPLPQQGSGESRGRGRG